ncbi:hypothetical protein GQX74_000391 [Glossina fuscipes]|nr:hypothetical protein GQX74_000391 [Glossina fuscipes]
MVPLFGESVTGGRCPHQGNEQRKQCEKKKEEEEQKKGSYSRTVLYHLFARTTKRRRYRVCWLVDWLVGWLVGWVGGWVVVLVALLMHIHELIKMCFTLAKVYKTLN